MRDPATLGVLIAIVVLVALVVVFLFQRSPIRRKPSEGAAAGLLALIEGDRARGIQLLSEVVGRPETPVEAVLALARTLREDGELDRALRLHQGLLARTALDPERRRLAELGTVDDLLALERVQEAHERLTALERHYRDPGVLRRLAMAQHRLGDREGALDTLVARAKLDPSTRPQAAAYAAEWSRDALIAAHPDRAERLARRALDLDTTCIAAWLARGEVARAGGRTEKAIELWMEGLRVAPRSCSRLLAPLLDASLATGSVERLLDELEEIRVDHPDDPWLGRAVADLRLRRGDRESFLALIADSPWAQEVGPEVWGGWVRHLQGRGDEGALLQVLARLPEAWGPRRWRCGSCGHEEPEPRSLCTACGSLDELRPYAGRGTGGAA